MCGHSVVFICLMWARWAESEAPPPFIRPEPIIMTSPQGSIHFNYHPLSSVCVRKPGKNTFTCSERWQIAREICQETGTSLWGIVKTGTCLYFGEIWWNRLSWSNRVAQHNICSTCCEVTVCVFVRVHTHCISACVTSVSLNMIKIPAASGTKGLHTEKSPPSLNALCL